MFSAPILAVDGTCGAVDMSDPLIQNDIRVESP
jgi:hypothetical protein